MRITFPVCADKLNYKFKIPANFDHGGLAILDGKIKVQQTQTKNMDFSAVLLSGNHVLEIYGSSGCCDKAYDFQFSVNKTKTMVMTAANLNQCYAKPTPKPAVEKPTFTPFPLVSSQIYVHTMPFEKNAVENLDELKQIMMKQPPAGYCEKVVESMKQVSNQALCGSKTRKNIGFYYKVIFPVAHDQSTYEFKIPNDFGHGGLVFLDGKV
jgi:hypothetical protein